MCLCLPVLKWTKGHTHTHTPNRWHSYMASWGTKITQQHVKGSSGVLAIYLNRTDHDHHQASVIIKNNSFRKKKIKAQLQLHSLFTVGFYANVRWFTCWHRHTHIGREKWRPITLFSFWLPVFTPNHTVTTSAAYYANRLACQANASCYAQVRVIRLSNFTIFALKL